MFTRILVPTDFSRPSAAALEYARRLVSSTGATLHVLHVVDNAFLSAVLGDPRDHEAAALERLHDQVPADGRGPAAVLATEQSDEPAVLIAGYARTHGIDLIAMGTHGRGGVAHLLLGSVAEKVARTSPCPVITMREPPPLHGAAGPRILVATDFSPCSDAALGCATRLAATLGGSIRLLHVMEHSAVGGSVRPETFVPEPPDIQAERVRKARSQLAHRILTDIGSQVAIASDVVYGPVSAMITAYAADNTFDLIVMGTRGRSGLAHLMMGSIAESVIRTARCPVLTVRSQIRSASHAAGRVPAHATAI